MVVWYCTTTLGDQVAREIIGALSHGSYPDLQHLNLSYIGMGPTAREVQIYHYY